MLTLKKSFIFPCWKLWADFSYLGVTEGNFICTTRIQNVKMEKEVKLGVKNGGLWDKTKLCKLLSSEYFLTTITCFFPIYVKKWRQKYALKY